jgi:amino acid adenylation domain-containing protein
MTIALTSRLGDANRAGRRVVASTAELEIWLAHHSEPESGRYNIPIALEFSGTLDMTALRRALGDVLDRYPVLTSRFEPDDGELWRQQVPGSPVPVGTLNLAGSYDRRKALEDAAAAGGRPLDPGTAPPLRADVLCYDGATVVVLTLHHILGDGRSLEILADSLLAFYRLRVTGADPRPPMSEPGRTQEPVTPVHPGGDSYWDRLLEGEPALLGPLPDLVRTEEQVRGPAARSVRELAADRLDTVRRVAVRHSVTPATVLLSVWSLLLHAWTGEDDGVLGMPFAGRDDLIGRDDIGLFTRVLPVRTRLGSGTSFGHYAARLGEQVWDSAEALASGGAPPADAAPRYTSLFRHQPITTTRWPVPGATVTLLYPDVASAKYDLSLTAAENSTGLELCIDYDSGLYRSATVDLMLCQLDLLLSAAVQRPAAGCRELLAGLATSASRRQPLPRPVAQARQPKLSSTATVPGMVLEQARQHPSAVAIVHGDQAMTYGELVRDAARIAHWLRCTGVRTDDVVAMVLRPGVRTVVAMLAIGLAGAAYLPIDPAYPDVQLSLIITDARPSLLLVESDQVDRVRDEGLRVHSLDEAYHMAGFMPATAPITSAGLDTAFNVLYTSGSTGRPKGVVLHHGGVLRMMHRPDFLALGSEDVVSHLSPLNFDGATYEIWGALTHGARLAVLNKELVLSPTELRAAVRELGVTTLLVTTPLLNRIVEDAPDLLQSLRRVYFGGELISVPHVRTALRWCRAGVLLHSYGPTENSFTSSWYPIAEVSANARTIPVGRGVPGTHLEVVFEGTLTPAPPYVPGELVLGGTGVARGYLGDPRSTAERFVADPFSGKPGARLYLTGDRARWSADGQLEFIGRVDNQVKIRSQRVELGEVESVLRAHPAVRAAFVTVRVNPRGEKEIIGYAVLDRPGALADVHCHLRACLPSFAVPSHLLVVDELPLMPNGKINRRQLPNPEPRTAPNPRPQAARPTPVRPSVGPARDLFAGVSAAWSEVLPSADFGPDDNFFDAGGHSLLLVRLQTALRRTTGLVPTIAELLRYTTVRAQVSLIGGGPAGTLGEPLPRVRERPAPARSDNAIAVVGMGARFAEAIDLDAYWDNLRQGRDCFAEGPAAVVTAFPDGTARVARWGMAAGGIAYDFDLLRFARADLRDGDPQHGLLHEVLWSSVEDASLRLSEIARRTSLYVGCAKILPTDAGARVDDVVNVDPTFVASRFAYLHNLWGEAVLVDTACSTGLYAVHLAVQSLRSGASDYALAGAVSLDGQSDGSYRYRPGFLYAEDGVCRPFDRRASGTVGGFGAGALLLRRLSDAERDGDPVYAVLAGSAVNNDGKSRIGYSAPGADGQVRVIRAALDEAGCDGADVGFVETHGTGTRLGDAIEATALGEALGPEGTPLAIGSVKASIGHCDRAAGVAGLIKAVLAVHHGYLPATPNVAEPIDELVRIGERFSLLARGRVWNSGDDRLRVAGVSSFGVGGTNAHVVVSEHRPAVQPPPGERR